MTNSMLSVQISGRYSPDNAGLFGFKRRLVEAGIIVKYPAGDEILEYVHRFAITTPAERTRPFHETELDLLVGVRSTDVQIVYSFLGDEEGYLGESTALETAWALIMGKPVVMLHPIRSVSPSISSPILALVRSRLESISISPLHLMNSEQIGSTLTGIVTNNVGESPLLADIETVLVETSRLAVKYSNDWHKFLQGEP